MLLRAATPVPHSLLHCDFTGQSGRNDLCKGTLLMLLLPAEAQFAPALIIQGWSTSVNTACQVKVQITSRNKAGLNNTQAIYWKVSIVHFASLRARVTRGSGAALFAKEHTEIFLQLHKKALDQQQLVE